MTIPPVSICIPAHNGRVHILQSVQSVLQQTHSDLELVIADDGSTDGTWELLQSVHDERVRLLRNEHQRGLEGNWRFAVEACRAPLVKLLCQDDLLYPECIARQADALRSAPAAGLVCCRRDFIDGAGRVIAPSRGWSRSGQIVPAGVARQRLTRGGRNYVGEPLAVLFRRSVYDAAGGFMGRWPYCIDVDLWLRMLAFGDLCTLGESLGAFRVWESALSWRLRSGQAAQYRMMLSEMHGCGQCTRGDLVLGSLRNRADHVARNAFYLWLRMRGRFGTL